MTAITSIRNDEHNYSHHANQHAQCNNDKRMHCIQHLKELSQSQSVEYLKEAGRVSWFVGAKFLIIVLSIKLGNAHVATLGNLSIDGLEKTFSLHSQSKHNHLQNKYKICEIHLSECQQNKLNDLFTRLDHNKEECERRRHDILRSAAG